MEASCRGQGARMGRGAKSGRTRENRDRQRRHPSLNEMVADDSSDSNHTHGGLKGKPTALLSPMGCRFILSNADGTKMHKHPYREMLLAGAHTARRGFGTRDHATTMESPAGRRQADHELLICASNVFFGPPGTGRLTGSLMGSQDSRRSGTRITTLRRRNLCQLRVIAEGAHCIPVTTWRISG